jgi:hypothetical protein
MGSPAFKGNGGGSRLSGMEDAAAENRAVKPEANPRAPQGIPRVWPGRA